MRTTEIKQNLKKLIGRNYQIYTTLNHVSQSGMLREITCLVAKKGKIINISKRVAAILDYKTGKKGGVKITGCGMDMGFAIVYNLSCALYCNDKYDHEKAYRLKHSWV